MEPVAIQHPDLTMGSNALDEARFRIGDLVISLFTEAGQGGFEIEDVYRRFRTSDPPEVILHQRMIRPPDLSEWEMVFDTQGVWRLYRQVTGDGVRYAIALHSARLGTEPYQTAIFNADFSRGELFPHEQYHSRRAVPFPLRYPLAEIIMINLLAQHRGILLHACGVKDGEHGYLFSGVSGAGKSTTASLWENQPGIKLLSDDRVILRKRSNGYWIYGTPWHGDARAACPEAARLEGIFILRHGEMNHLTPLSPLDLTARLLVRSFPPFWDASGMDFSLGFLAELSQTVPGYDFDFLPDPSAVEYIRWSCAH